MTPALVSRALSPENPKSGLPCPHCGTFRLGVHGPTCVSGFTFAAAEVAEALVATGRGISYSEISADIRRGVMRSRQSGRTSRKLEPRQPGPVRTPRPLMDPKAYGRHLPKGTTTRKAYNYTRSRAVKTHLVQPSRTGNLAQSYVDVFAPVVLAAFPSPSGPTSS